MAHQEVIALAINAFSLAHHSEPRLTRGSDIKR